MNKTSDILKIIEQANQLFKNKKPRVEFYEDIKTSNSKQRYRWRLYFSSDIVAASSEGYSSKAEALENFIKIEQHIKYLRENNLIK